MFIPHHLFPYLCNFMMLFFAQNYSLINIKMMRQTCVRLMSIYFLYHQSCLLNNQKSVFVRIWKINLLIILRSIKSLTTQRIFAFVSTSFYSLKPSILWPVIKLPTFTSTKAGANWIKSLAFKGFRC